MEEQPTNGLREKAERRKRIERMKRGIVLTIICWMIISMLTRKRRKTVIIWMCLPLKKDFVCMVIRRKCR